MKALTIIRRAALQSAHAHFNEGATSTANLPMGADYEAAAFDLGRDLTDAEEIAFRDAFEDALENLLED